MMKYYRSTNSNSPMSDWGHAMFADRDLEGQFGANEYGYDGTNGVEIESLKDDIITVWNQCKEDETFPGLNDSYYESLTAETVYESFVCEDIVDSANGFDSSLVCWLYAAILEPKNIGAVITPDGAVVFDESLITYTGTVFERLGEYA